MFGKFSGYSPNEIDVSIDTLVSIVALARTYEDGMVTKTSEGIGPGLSSQSHHGIIRQAARDLCGAIDLLSDDEQAVLVALSSIGRGEFGAHEFDFALTIAFARQGGKTSDFLIGLPMLADCLETGAAECGAHLGGVQRRAFTKSTGAAH